MDEHELPADPDLDDLPDELAQHRGSFKIVGEDERVNVWEAPISREELAAAFADRRRALGWKLTTTGRSPRE